MKKRSLLSLLVIVMFNMLPRIAHGQTITTIAGCGIGDDSFATKAELVGPVGITIDTAGNIYVADGGSYRLRKINAAGIITTFAGNGIFGYSGDGGPATAAQVGVIYGIAADRKGNVYFADDENNCIRKVNAAGIISTIAGTGYNGFSGDGGPATAALLNNPTDLLVDTAGNIIFTDWQNYRVRKINTSGIISTIVGDGTIGSSGAGGPATATELGSPFRVTMDNKGNLYVAEVVYQCICKVDTAGILTIIADATGTYAMGPDGDGGPATAAVMTSPCGLAVDTSGHLYFSDIGNSRIRMIDMNTGIISNYAAKGLAGYSGDGGPATAAQISTPEALVCGPTGSLYICDADNNRIRKVDTHGIIFTVAGQNGLFGENYTAVNAELCGPENIATDAAGNVYVPDFNNHRVRMINAATGLITTVAGSGISGYDDAFSGDGGPAISAELYYPTAVAVDATGNLYICDQDNQRIRMVTTAGIISTIAGNGTAGPSGDGHAAISAELNYPTGVTVDGAGNVYIADNQNNRVRKINTSGIISTVAGTGVAGNTGDGGPAGAAKLNGPTDVAVDAIGNVYISDGINATIRKVDTTGTITTIAGTGTPGYTGDGGSAISAQLAYPTAIKVDNADNIYIADDNQTVRVINSGGIITTVAGNGTAGFSGDDGPAVSAMLYSPSGVAVNAVGDLFISDRNNNRIRKVNLSILSVQTINKASLENVNVYPNPTTGTVNIINAANSNVVIYDVVGKAVMSAVITGDKASLSIETLANGIYVLQVTNNNGDKKIVKLIKE